MKTTIATAVLAAGALLSTAQNYQPINDGWKFMKGDNAQNKLTTTSDSQWQLVDIPHDWSIASAPSKINPSQGEGGYYATGKGWYRKTINIPDEMKGQKIYLYCEGIYMNSEIYVNGKLTGGHKYGYSSFYVDITANALIGKENLIAIKADNSQQKNCRWYAGSGIYRNIWLVSCPKVHLDVYPPFVYTKSIDGSQATVVMEARVINETSNTQKCQISLGDVSESISIKANDTITIRKEFHHAPSEWWTPENPHLVTKKIILTTADGQTCEREVTYGARKFDYSPDKGLILNGKTIILNGACVHHDNGMLGAAAYTDAEYRKAWLLKTSGFNAVRTSHNPPSTAFLDACDKYGLIVIDEAFDGWRQAKNKHDYAEILEENWRDDLSKMILRDRSHPSIFCWSIGNEILERKSDSAVALAHDMRSLIRGLDNTRPVTQALASWDDDWEIYDPLAAEHDIIGYNYLIHKAADDHQRVPSRMIIQTESFPKDAYSNYRATADNTYVLGDFVWTGIDYLGESGIGRYYYEGETEGESWMANMFPWHGAYCGDIDITGWRKPISHYRSMLWNQDGEQLYMAVREPNGYYGNVKTTMWSVWPTWESWSWPGHEGKNIDIEIYSHSPRVRLMLNDKPMGEKDIENGMATFTIPYQPGTIRAEAIGSQNNIKPVSLRTAGNPASIRLSKMEIPNAPNEIHFYEVEVLDKDGIPCPGADCEISFSLLNPDSARIIATGSADLKDKTPATSTTRKAWKGRAMVVAKGEKPRIEARASVNGEMIKGGN